MQQALCGQQVAVGRARGTRAAKRQVLVQAAGFTVPPAWPGRVPVPETLPQHDGPKVRWRLHACW